MERHSTLLYKASTIRLILSLAVSFEWEIKQLDINNAFLNGFLQDIIFVAQLEGFEDPNKPNHVCRLTKALYDLKQVPKA